MIRTATGFYLRHEKALLILAVGIFFVVGYLGIALYTSQLDSHSLPTRLDSAIPYLPGAWPLYQAVYLLIFIPTRLFSRSTEMRRGAAANASCMAIAYALFLIYPVRDPAPAATGLLEGVALAGGRFAVLFDDRGMNCFPSLHVALATIAALCCTRADRRLGFAAWTLTALVAFSSLLLKRHYLVDLPAGFFLGASMYAIFLRGHLGGIDPPLSPVTRGGRGAAPGRRALTLLALALASLSAPSAHADEARAVVIEGRAVPGLLGEPIAGLRLLVWTGNGWGPAPYQIDPRVRLARSKRPGRLLYLLGSPGGTDPADTRVLSADDELVFMAGDLGPEPPEGASPPGSRAGAILGVGGDGGFAGLFAFDAPPPQSKRRYVRYNAAADEIQARSYTLAFSKDHPIVFDSLRLHPPADPPVSRPAPDIVDRVKIRVRGRILGLFPLRRDESDFRTILDGVRPGPVRVVRGCIHRLPLLPGFRSPEVREEQIFYPDGYEFPIWFAKSTAMGRLLTRLSLRIGPDWSPAARGMRAHVDRGAGPFLVDGRMDAAELAFEGQGASWSVLEDGRTALFSRISAADGPVSRPQIPFRLQYRDAAGESDPPEEHQGRMGSLAFEFSALQKLPPGEYRWVVRTRIIAGYQPGAETAVLSALAPITAVRVRNVSGPHAPAEKQSEPTP